MGDLATLLIGIPVAALAAIDICLRLRDGWADKKRRELLETETNWLREQCHHALDRNESRTLQEINGRHAGRGTFHSGMRERDASEAQAWFSRTREMVETADRDTLRKVLFGLEPVPRLPLTSGDIWRDLSAQKVHDLVGEAHALVRAELKRRER